MEKINNQVVKAGSIDLAYIKTHFKDLEDETCKIVIKEKASKITISHLDEVAGCFIPIMVIDVGEYNSGSFCFTELFQMEVE